MDGEAGEQETERREREKNNLPGGRRKEEGLFSWGGKGKVEALG